jgi:hypothetical protein
VAERLFIHVGSPKSGTTYLQSLLWSNKDKLSSAGVLVPGAGKFDHNRIAQAVRWVHPDANARRAWRQVFEEVHDWPGTAVLSNEWLCAANQAQARRTIEAFRPCDIHVIATARDLVRAVPSAWQEMLKLGLSTTLLDFIERMGDPTFRWRWSALDPSLTLPRWQASLPRGNVHLVTVTSGGGPPDLLWQRFAGILGVSSVGLDLDAGLNNESLGAESARLLEVMGARLRAAVGADHPGWNQMYLAIRELFAHELLVPRGGSRIAIGPDEFGLIRERSHACLRRLSVSPYDIVGDVEELVSATIPEGAVNPDDVSETRLLDLAGDVLADLLVRARQETRRAERAERKVRELEDELRPRTREGRGVRPRR